MNTFNSFYFEYLDNRINSSDHSQWRDDLDNLTYITTLFRDPCKQVISLYVHGLAIDSNGQKINSSISGVTKKDFFLWFENNKETLRNYQSKNIISTTIKKEESFYLTFSKIFIFALAFVIVRIIVRSIVGDFGMHI